MSANRPLNIPGRRKVITKNMILEAQKHTKSNMAAAKWMNVCYTTYRKWAKYYKVFDQHLNQTGVGIQKGWVTRTTNVEDIILGKRKVPRKWSQSTVKEELIKKGYDVGSDSVATSYSSNPKKNPLNWKKKVTVN